ncbi:MAG: mannose-1-phosphate guanylyltransferase/mannose-6-phosphate isomerase [Acidiferrobacterales bacterium]
MTINTVILSGGSGTRLWPLSREHYPKQLLPLMRDLSLLQETAMRLDGLDSVSDPLLICNEEHRFLVAEQIRQIGKTTAGILLEPVGRNTAPAMTLAALALAIGGRDTVMLVMPADHIIQDVAAFRHAVAHGAELAREGQLVTFGIVPHAPETGFGYIRRAEPVGTSKTPNGGNAAYHVGKFVEKPDLAAAQGYIESGEYFWNSGIFMSLATVWLDEIMRHRPDVAQSCIRAYEQGKSDADFFRVDKTAFAGCPGVSIDYAVMEKTDRAVVVPLDAGWSDVGAWSSLWEVSPRDENGNVVKGDVETYATCNALLISQHRLVVAIGLEDMVVVETADAVLVAHKDRAQDVKEIVTRLKEKNREEYKTHRKVYRPWGSYEGIDAGLRFQVKRIIVNPGAALSLQMHHHRAEHWVVVTGTARVTRGEEVFLLSENQSTYIPLGTQHRLENPGTIPLEMIEVQSGAYLGEDDIVRFEDRYNRG